MVIDAELRRAVIPLRKQARRRDINGYNAFRCKALGRLIRCDIGTHARHGLGVWDDISRFPHTPERAAKRSSRPERIAVRTAVRKDEKIFLLQERLGKGPGVHASSSGLPVSSFSMRPEIYAPCSMEWSISNTSSGV